MAAVMAACAFVGLTPTFWTPMTRGAFTSPVITIHGLAVYYGVFHGHMPVPAGMPSPPPPVDMGYLVDPFLLVPLVYDWRVRGRPHPAYLWGAGAVTLMRALRPAISRTAAWHAMAAWMLSLAGA
jgi:hypothetical protein